MTPGRRGVRAATSARGHRSRGTTPPGVRIATACTGLLVVACTGPADPPWVDAVAIDPPYVAFTVGESETLRAVPLDRSENPLPDRTSRVAFEVLDPDLVRLEALGDGRAVVTALELGTTRVRARLGRGTGTVTIDVQPPGLADVRIEPNPVEMGVFSGTIRTVTAILLDAEGLEMSPQGFRFLWSVADTTVVTLSTLSEGRAMLRAGGVGRTEITVRVGRIQETAPVVVETR